MASSPIPNYLADMMGKWEVPQTVEDIIPGRGLFSMASLNSNLPEMAEVHEDVVLIKRSGTDDLTAEIYVPRGTKPIPVLLYIHGGAFCLENATDVRRLAMLFAENGCVVVNINYRLAPENPFPAAVEDCTYAARWIVHNIAEYGGDGSRIIIAGDSAGANLAAATIVALQNFEFDIDFDEGDLAGVEPNFSAAVLLYGPFDSLLGFMEPGDLIGITEVMWHQAYLGSHFLKYVRHPLASPIYALNLHGFPPTYLSCGQDDSLLGHTLSMTKALSNAKVPTTASIVSRTAHFFAQFDEHLPQANSELQRIFSWIRSELG